MNTYCTNFYINERLMTLSYFLKLTFGVLTYKTSLIIHVYRRVTNLEANKTLFSPEWFDYMYIYL